ncbi:LuxR C-terminal-related transcriptional regulator [Streptomyces sp. NPDC093970]|uniref:LuxR C-terminal-related transcriptional regulator n=1 Tax=Streptomyces sp. NPDC093970 TaxID=3155076 RepID=UPI00342FE2E4
MTRSVPAFKLRPPTQPPHLLPRPRLSRRLDAVTEPVVVVRAPAGAGKTVLLAEWSRDLAAREECAWLSLDTYDNVPGRLWNGILGALRRLRPGLPESADGAAWTLAAWLEEVLPDLLTGLDGGSPLTLVLDGLESITDAEALHSMGAFLARLPRGLRVVLSTRHTPGTPLPALRARGTVAELDQHDLRFTLDEARQVVTGLLGTDCPEQTLGAVYEATEGWAAGLCVMGRALRRSGAEPGAADLARARQEVAEYLTTEVLDRLTTEQRDFLLRTSVLDVLRTGPCQALTGERAGVLLRELARTVHLLVPVASETPAYRRHRALTSLLSDVLGSETPDAATRLHEAAASWYSRQGETTEAVRHFLLAGDRDAAVAVVLGDWEEAIAAGRGADVTGWLGLLPSRAVAADARLCVVAAMADLAEGAPDTGRLWLDVARLRQSGRQPVGTGGTVSGASAVAQTVANCLRGEVLAADRLGEAAVAGTPPLTYWHALACTARGTALLWSRRYAEAEELLAEATRDAYAAGHGLALVRALGSRALCALLSGRCERARTLSDEAVREAEVSGLQRHFVAAPAHLARAGVLLEDGSVDGAARSLAAAEAALARFAPTGSEPHLRTLYHLVRARVEHARHDTEAERNSRAEAERAAKACVFPETLMDLMPETTEHEPPAPAAAGPEDLSLGERRVLRALCGPLTLREIAAELYVSHNTVKTQVRSIFRKLGAHTRSGAVARARECGVL